MAPLVHEACQRAMAQLLADAQELITLPRLLLLLGVVLLALALYIARGQLEASLIPSVHVHTEEAEANDKISAIKHDPKKKQDKDVVPCYDPGTMQLLGHVPAMSRPEVKAVVQRARTAQQTWKHSTFSERRRVLKILLKFIIENQETICRVAARDSGKAMLDAVLGEVIVTCEKIHWLCNEGEKWLKPEKRSSGILSFYKSARVEYHPVGVLGAIVPWNYPFHNVINPLTTCLFTGNALVIKVSEHASWSAGYYGRMINSVLAAGGAPPDLVQFVTGYAEAGNALVTGGVDKLIFIGSTLVGKKVMAAAAETLTPVTLELGGKDPVIFCDDVNIEESVQTALKAAFLNCGQNCAGGERFFVHAKIHDQFAAKAAEVIHKMRQGPALGDETVDCGAMCMPGLAEKIQGMVDDAVAKGAKVLAGGKLPKDLPGQFYPPTVLTHVNKTMEIWHEEVFGPVMCIIPWSTDDEVVALANDSPFGLGSNVFSGNQARSRDIAFRLEAGMSTINDFATTYMCQSLPFGGVKHSGFDRFGGIEGLRGLCHPKAVCEDRVPWLMKSSLPPPWQYPVQDIAFPFGTSLVSMFYGPGIVCKAKGLLRLAACFLAPHTVSRKQGKKHE